VLKEGHEVTVLDNLIWGIQGVCINFGKPRFTFVEGDVRNDELVCSVLKGQDVVVHLAALVVKIFVKLIRLRHPMLMLMVPE